MALCVALRSICLPSLAVGTHTLGSQAKSSGKVRFLRSKEQLIQSIFFSNFRSKAGGSTPSARAIAINSITYEALVSGLRLRDVSTFPVPPVIPIGTAASLPNGPPKRSCNELT